MDIAVPASLNLGTMKVGSQGTATPVKFDIHGGTTIGGAAVLTSGVTDKDFLKGPGGDCVEGTYKATTTCHVNVIFRPRFPGLRNGAVVIYDKAGSVIATVFLHGTGSGPQTVYNTGRWFPFRSGSTFFVGQAMAIDGDGNLFLTDVYKDAVIEVKHVGYKFGAPFEVVKNLNFYIFGIALDGAGNLYIADQGTDSVYRTPRRANGYGPTTQMGSNLNFPYGVAVDSEGSVYVTDTWRGHIYKIPWTGNSFGEQIKVTSNLSIPYALAVDGEGNVYVANHGDDSSGNTGHIYKVPWSGKQYNQWIEIGSGWIAPTGVTLDGSGNVYVSDSDPDGDVPGSVWVVPWNGKAYGPQQSLLEAWGPSPEGIAVDEKGNVYLANIDTGSGLEIVRDTPNPPGSFGESEIAPANADREDSVSIQNIGNGPLSLVSPGDFDSISDGIQSGSACNTVLPLDPGMNCKATGSITQFETPTARIQ